jgi:transposase
MMMLGVNTTSSTQGDLRDMISQETRLMIRHFVREGEPKSRVARRLGVSRQTVYNYLRYDPERKKQRKKRASKLDPYRGYIRTRLEEFDLPATVLLREIREKGYRGSMTILREYVRGVKDRKVARITERFETVPGHQAQVDWGECGSIEVGGIRHKLYVFVLVLGFSRMLFVRFTTSIRRHVLQGCLQEAFGRLGIPAELLLDNMKQVIEGRSGEGIRFNGGFLDFCEHYGVVPLVTPPYWPRAKGKVERGVGYVKRSFLEGRVFVDLADLNRQADHWVDMVANVRVHGTTGERPCDRYLRETASLRRYEAVPVYDSRPMEIRKVMSDSHIRYQGVFYSVDPVAVGRSVVVKAASERVGDEFEVYLGGELVAVHRRRAAGSPRVTLEEHGRKIRQQVRRGKAVRGRQVRFVQVASEEVGWEYFAVPEVQTRSLELYEQVLRGGSR